MFGSVYIYAKKHKVCPMSEQGTVTNHVPLVGWAWRSAIWIDKYNFRESTRPTHSCHCSINVTEIRLWITPDVIHCASHKDTKSGAQPYVDRLTESQYLVPVHAAVPDATSCVWFGRYPVTLDGSLSLWTVPCWCWQKTSGVIHSGEKFSTSHSVNLPVSTFCRVYMQSTPSSACSQMVLRPS